MKHSIPHPLGPERARRVAEQAFASYAERFAEYRPALRWLDAQRAETSFTVKGVTLTGSIEVGKLGDLAILAEDFMICSEEQIKGMKVAATVVGGRIVHLQEQP